MLAATLPQTSEINGGSEEFLESLTIFVQKFGNLQIITMTNLIVIVCTDALQTTGSARQIHKLIEWIDIKYQLG